ncbi:MAG TPA: class I SAM-dependent methyltransferase [Abditibacteriaceae bacterium]|jgi:SAM-dependent methyltransferase
MKTPLHAARSVLSLPAAYRAFRTLVSGNLPHFVREYIPAKAGDRVLDIGCGPGDILMFLPDVHYVGFDSEPTYIQAAQRRYGKRGEFFCERVSRSTLEEHGAFDIVLAIGVVHHLDDGEAVQLFELAHSALRSGGVLVTLDGCYVAGQSPFARRMLDNDRGQFVRNEEQYMALASQVFSECKAAIRHDLLRLPYTHLILQCTKS